MSADEIAGFEQAVALIVERVAFAFLAAVACLVVVWAIRVVIAGRGS